MLHLAHQSGGCPGSPWETSLATDEHCTEIDDSLLRLIAPRGSFHCHRVRSVDDGRGGADRRSHGRRGPTLVRRQRKPDSLLETTRAQEGAGLLGWKQEAAGWI